MSKITDIYNQVAEICILKINFYFYEMDHLQKKIFKQNEIYIVGMSDGEQNTLRHSKSMSEFKVTKTCPNVSY